MTFCVGGGLPTPGMDDVRSVTLSHPGNIRAHAEVYRVGPHRTRNGKTVLDEAEFGELLDCVAGSVEDLFTRQPQHFPACSSAGSLTIAVGAEEAKCVFIPGDIDTSGFGPAGLPPRYQSGQPHPTLAAIEMLVRLDAWADRLLGDPPNRYRRIRG